jgi:MFS transporter, DHA3 family, macrolide efflux protein
MWKRREPIFERTAEAGPRASENTFAKLSQLYQNSARSRMNLSLFRNKRFLSLWLTAALSTFALAIAWVGESWYAINVLGKANEFGYILICGMVPRLIFMLIGGAIADAFSKKYVIATSLGLRAALLVALGGAILAGYAGFTFILVLAFLYGVIDAYYWPSRDAILVEVLEKDELPRANSIMLTTGQVGLIVGPALGGILIGFFELSYVILALGLLLLLTALIFLVLMREHVSGSPVTAKDRDKTVREKIGAFLGQLKAGLIYVRDHPQFSVLMLIFAIANILFMGPLQQSVPLLATKDFGGTASAFGNLWSTWAVGMAAGGVFMSFLAPQRKRFLLLVSMLLLESVFLVALAFAGSLAVGCAIMFGIGFCIACNNVPTMSILQVYSDKDKVGRVMGFNDTISMGLTPLSYVAVSVLLMFGVGHKMILMTAGAALLIFCLFMLARYPVIRTTD